jgi:hypothetical protein
MEKINDQEDLVWDNHADVRIYRFCRRAGGCRSLLQPARSVLQLGPRLLLDG